MEWQSLVISGLLLSINHGHTIAMGQKQRILGNNDGATAIERRLDQLKCCAYVFDRYASPWRIGYGKARGIRKWELFKNYTNILLDYKFNKSQLKGTINLR